MVCLSDSQCTEGLSVCVLSDFTHVFTLTMSCLLRVSLCKQEYGLNMLKWSPQLPPILSKTVTKFCKVYFLKIFPVGMPPESIADSPSLDTCYNIIL